MRLVKWRIPDAGEACLVGRILCMSGSEAGVAFADLDDAVWLPCCALEAEPGADYRQCCDKIERNTKRLPSFYKEHGARERKQLNN